MHRFILAVVIALLSVGAPAQDFTTYQTEIRSDSAPNGDASIATGFAAIPTGPAEHTIDKQFLEYAGIYAAAASFDLATTIALRGNGMFEDDPLFGKTPSNARLIGEGLAIHLGVDALAYVLKKHNSRYWKYPLWTMTALHLGAGTWNAVCLTRVRGTMIRFNTSGTWNETLSCK